MKRFAYALALTLAACAADRDAQDFQNDQALRDIARVNEIAGKYSGRLLSSEGELVGMMTVELRANPQVTPGGSGEIGAGLKTIVTIRTDRVVTVSLDSGFYDWRSRTLKAEQLVLIDGATSHNAEIFGSFEDDDRTLRGEIGIAEFPESASTFVLKKNRKIRPEETPGENPDELAPGEAWQYSGVFANSRDELADCRDNPRGCTKIRMALQSQSNSRLQEFVELLAPVKYVDLTLGFEGFSVNFPGTYWDLTNNELQGVSPRGEFSITLNCKSENAALYWNCTYFKHSQTQKAYFHVVRERD